MKPTSGLGCITRKTPGSIGCSAKLGCQGADRYSDADTGKLALRRKLLQAPAALVAPSASSVYSSADKVGHTMPYTQQRAGKINQLPKPHITLPSMNCGQHSQMRHSLRAYLPVRAVIVAGLPGRRFCTSYCAERGPTPDPSREDGSGIRSYALHVLPPGFHATRVLRGRA
jgi:hypothetical protein